MTVKKKLVLWCIAVVVALGIVIDGVVSTIAENRAYAVEHEVKYEVTGTASKAHITYFDEVGPRESEELLPWARTFKMKRGTVISLTVSSRDPDGSVVATVYVDSVAKETATGVGFTGVAQVSADL